MSDPNTPPPASDFIRDRVRADLDSGKVQQVVTRFPPTLNPLLPDTSQVGGFFKTGTRLAGPGSHPSAHASARYVIDPPGPWAYASTLELAWMHDAWPEPLYRARAQLGLTLLRQQEWHR